MDSGAKQQGRPKCNESGYMLLLLMVAVAMLTITLLAVAPNYRRSIRRDQEVEMIHRGVQYERAVRLYYHQFHRYPTSIEDLEDTNKMRFLRRRYKDPMSPDGKWQIAHIQDIKLDNITGLTAAVAGAGIPGAPAALNAATVNAAVSLQTNAQNAASVASAFSNSTPDNSAGTDKASASGGQPTNGTNASSGPADTSSSGFGNVLGGGPMLGVISRSKAEGIHSFNDKSHYNAWYFIYDPSQDKGQVPTGPYNPNLLLNTANQAGQPGSPPAQNPGTATPTTTPPTPQAAPSPSPNP